MTCPGPTGRLCPSHPPASLASCATPKMAERIICSVSGFLSQKTSISSSFSWDNFVPSSCFFNKVAVVGLCRISYEVLGPFPGGFSCFSSAFNL